jgi:UDP-N-acetylglucosamine--N-acetylmuramyl-(pentapeptide) pyrophosphoryl-undecaprenol N-acetylglucosamine transferase
VVIAAGGTGGHMFPALAVVDALRRRGCQVALITDRRGARYAVSEPRLRVIDAASPSGGMRAHLSFLVALSRGLAASLRILRELRPSAAAAFGGYACVPTALACSMMRVPLLVHEQNAVLGRANRLLARIARALALSFSGTEHIPQRAPRQLLTGNPVRPGFALSGADPAAGDRFRVLVLGGSQGARVFSELVPAAVALLPAALRSRLDLAQQCRPEDLEGVRGAYDGLGFAAELASFFEDVPERLAAADLVIARSGASTVAELLASGRPSLLVPYPYAADDHQTANARALEREGAALMLPQSKLTADRLAATLEKLMTHRDHRMAMQERARSLARLDAADRLADAIVEIARPETCR